MKRYLFLFIVTAALLNSCSQELDNRFDMDRAEMVFSKEYNGRSIEELEEAAKIYREVIEQKIEAADKLVEVYQMLGEQSLHERHYSMAVRYFKQALSVEPQSTGLHYYTGISYGHWAHGTMNAEQKADHLAKAEKHLRYAVENNPGIAKYHASLATLLSYDKGKHDEALEHIKQALRISENDIDYLFIKAAIEYNKEDYNRAISTYQDLERLVNKMSGKLPNFSELKKRIRDNTAKVLRARSGSGT